MYLILNEPFELNVFMSLDLGGGNFIWRNVKNLKIIPINLPFFIRSLESLKSFYRVVNRNFKFLNILVFIICF